jgi:hypothetical protein
MLSHKSYLKIFVNAKTKNSRANDEQSHLYNYGPAENSDWFELKDDLKNEKDEDVLTYLCKFIEDNKNEWFDKNDALNDEGKKELKDIINSIQKNNHELLPYTKWCLQQLKSFLGTLKENIQKKNTVTSDEEIELNATHYASHFDFFDSEMHRKMEELDKSIKEYNTKKAKFNKLRIRQLKTILNTMKATIFSKKFLITPSISTLKTLNKNISELLQTLKIEFNKLQTSQLKTIKATTIPQRKIHILSKISTLQAVNEDILGLLQTLNQIQIKCDQLLIDPRSTNKAKKNIRQKITILSTKINAETSRLEKSSACILNLEDEMQKICQTEIYKQELSREEKSNSNIMKNMETIINSVMEKENFHRFEGNAKSNYLYDAYQDWCYQYENKELGGKNYDIEDVISAFKVFLICCLQNKSLDNGCFGSFFKGRTTTTGKKILNQYKLELIHILYRDLSGPIELDYDKLANDLLIEENVCKAKELISRHNHNETTTLTIQEWIRPQPRR